MSAVGRGRATKRARVAPQRSYASSADPSRGLTAELPPELLFELIDVLLRDDPQAVLDLCSADTTLARLCSAQVRVARVAPTLAASGVFPETLPIWDTARELANLGDPVRCALLGWYLLVRMNFRRALRGGGIAAARIESGLTPVFSADSLRGISRNDLLLWASGTSTSANMLLRYSVLRELMRKPRLPPLWADATYTSNLAGRNARNSYGMPTSVWGSAAAPREELLRASHVVVKNDSSSDDGADWFAFAVAVPLASLGDAAHVNPDVALDAAFTAGALNVAILQTLDSAVRNSLARGAPATLILQPSCGAVDFSVVVPCDVIAIKLPVAVRIYARVAFDPGEISPVGPNYWFP